MIPETENKSKVWYRFEKRRKDGTLFKLRIQDLPEDRRDEMTDLMMKHYTTEEPVHKGVGITKDPETYKMYSQYLREMLNDTKYSAVICCADETEDIKDIMGISLICLITDYNEWNIVSDDDKPATKEWEKFMAICSDVMLAFNPMEEYNLSVFYDDKALLVLPDFRGLGIAEALLKTRRMVSAAHGVPMTGAWMTGSGSQIAAARDGWEVASEINYQELAKKHGVTFTDVPETMKFMIGKAHK